ncbi:MAG: redox-regulated ATPase YchF [Candidatus Zixiibacteriota bacterium]|nr:MAG: redox-regulated ATPase YchF [candidate division Zixibacteria bacterium]
MKLGIIGLPQSGKTTLFNAVSGQEAAVGDYSRAEHRAVVKVPDERVENLYSLIKSKKLTHAEIEFLDSTGFTGKGKNSSGELGNIHELRLLDAFAIVVDYFTPDAVPEQDISAIVDEMILADMILIENNLDKLDRSIKLTGKMDRARELELLKICREALENEKMLSEIGLSESDKKELRGYCFLTLKPQLIVLNISEDKLPDAEQINTDFSKFKKENIRDISVICGQLQMELAQLSEEEQREFLDDMNIKKSAHERFIQKSYELLGLISFFTIGAPETRAWTIKKGTTAPKAAGIIHTDFERGFIRAEVATYEDYMKYKTLPALKAAAKLHVEGKEYIVNDGDVILFLFNV